MRRALASLLPRRRRPAEAALRTVVVRDQRWYVETASSAAVGTLIDREGDWGYIVFKRVEGWQFTVADHGAGYRDRESAQRAMQASIGRA